MEDNTDADRPKRLADLAKDIAGEYDKQQKVYLEAAQDAGYGKDVFSYLAKTLESTPDDAQFEQTERSLNKFRIFAMAQTANANEMRIDVRTTAYAQANTSSTAVAISVAHSGMLAQNQSQSVVMWPVRVPFVQIPPNWTRTRFLAYAERLTQFDHELGIVYRSVWEQFNTGLESAERAALQMMRQSYDHLFRVLAPDELVRNSPFFQKKKTGNPDAVHRPERLRFAANKFVSNLEKRDVLESQVEDVLASYSRLNKLHDNQKLDRLFVRETLYAMQAVMEQWVDAIDIGLISR